LIAVSLSCVLVALGRWLLENFHAVVPGLVYRSGQLEPQRLASYLARYRIRSLVNLRGAHPDESWYQEERAVTCRLGVRFYDLPIDSNAPNPTERIELARTLEFCPKPVLLHCNSGIDRTGLAAGMSVLLLKDGGTVEEACGQLSWWFGDLAWRDHRAQQHAFFQDYEAWLTERGEVHEPARFLEWLIATGPSERAVLNPFVDAHDSSWRRYPGAVIATRSPTSISRFAGAMPNR
jgi:hypothetical protein